MRRRITCFSLVIIGLLSTAGLARAETWRMYTYVPNGNLAAGSGSQRIADRITSESSGRLTVQHFFGGSLPIKATDIARAVGDDIVQIATDGFYSGAIAYGSILRLPLLIQSPQEYEKAFPIVRDAMDRQFASVGVKIIGHYTWPASTIFGTFSVTKAADLRGRKIRQGDPGTTDFLKLFGAAPIVLGSAEVASALQLGAIQGVVSTSGGGARLWESMLTHNYRMPTYASASLMFVNKERFEKLPADLQALVRKVVTEEAAIISEANNQDEAVAMKKHASMGMVITEPSKEEVQGAAKGVELMWTAWGKQHGADAERLIAQMRAALGR